MLEGPQRVGANREYHTYIGTWKGQKLAVASHGVGGGGASCCFEELIQAGVTTIIRAGNQLIDGDNIMLERTLMLFLGTAGSFDPRFKEGSLVIATGLYFKFTMFFTAHSCVNT